MVGAMSDEGGGRGARDAGQPGTPHSRHTAGGAGPMVGRRTRVENAPLGVPPVHAVDDGDEGQYRVDMPPGDGGEASITSAIDAPISILDLFGPPVTPTAASTAPDGTSVQRKST